MDLEQGVSAGLGITVDKDGEVVVLVAIATEGHQVAVPMTPNIASVFGKAMREMAREAQALQDEIGDLTQENVEERLIDIQKRHAAQTN